eukprot:SAG25_NODE_34_length_20232_cov_4.725534_7_plen_89_part_00
MLAVCAIVWGQLLRSHQGIDTQGATGPLVLQLWLGVAAGWCILTVLAGFAASVHRKPVGVPVAAVAALAGVGGVVTMAAAGASGRLWP